MQKRNVDFRFAFGVQLDLFDIADNADDFARRLLESLAKIDLLAEVVNRFREAVHNEAKLIDQQAEKQNK